MSVLEAVLAALIVTAGIAMIVTTSSPPAPHAGSGADLARFPHDILAGLAERNATDPAAHPNWLAEQANLTLAGSATDLESFLDAAMPVGTRYQVRLANGVDTLRVLPTGPGASPPLAATASAWFVTPDWRAHTGIAVASGQPGAAYDASLYACASSPAGTTTRPDGDTWIDHWDAVIPSDAPLGKWSLHVLGDCSGAGVIVDVLAPGGTSVTLPPYPLQLVVWQGA